MADREKTLNIDLQTFVDGENPLNFCERIIMKVRETEKDFIWETLDPFCFSVENRQLSKAELDRAIKLMGKYKEGKWIHISKCRAFMTFHEGDTGSWVCSNCNHVPVSETAWEYDYCPSCGSRMERGDINDAKP